MFPLSDSIKSKRFPFLNLAIVVVTVYVFFRQVMTPDFEAFIFQYALVPRLVDFSNFETFLPFITSIFLHGGFLHLLSNMWFLIVFGDNVETHLNPIIFLFLYFVAGVAGGVSQYLLMPDANIPMLGASGAVAGVLGCYYVLFPHSRIKTLVFILFFVTIVNISAPFMLGYWFVLQVLSALSAGSELAAQGGVAFMAHVVGFIIGVLFGNIFRGKRDQAFEK